MIFEVECYTTKDELTDRTHTMIVPFIVLDYLGVGWTGESQIGPGLARHVEHPEYR